MALVNRATNEVTVKLVYYGPGLCGKTTNLEKIYGNPKLSNKGKMISMATETDRTLFFDFMPMELGEIGGKKIRVQLYTVPGQVFYDATRKLVLRGSDGIVFVADSQTSVRDSNIESLDNLYTNLRINKLDPDKVALVIQLNKRDLPNVDSVEEMTAYLNPRPGVAVVEASAINGIGVTATMRAAVTAILGNLKKNVDISLKEEAPAEAPMEDADELGEVAGAEDEVASTEDELGEVAGAEDEVAGTEDEVVEEVPIVSKLEPAPLDEVSPLELSPGPAEISLGEPEEQSPFDIAGTAARDELLSPIEESPFDETVPTSLAIVDPLADEAPFGDVDTEASDHESVALELDTDRELTALLTKAEDLVKSLEDTLARARQQVDEIAAKLRG